MDEYTAQLFYTVAQLAGIFVGFGALISVSSNRSASGRELEAISGVVMIGLFVIGGALVPAALHAYGLSADRLWVIASVVLLIFNWFTLWLQWSIVRRQFTDRRPADMFFWFFLEASVEIPLILVVLPVLSDFSSALYSTALVVSILQAVHVMVILVLGHARPGSPIQGAVDEPRT